MAQKVRKGKKFIAEKIKIKTCIGMNRSFKTKGLSTSLQINESYEQVKFLNLFKMHEFDVLFDKWPSKVEVEV